MHLFTLFCLLLFPLRPPGPDHAQTQAMGADGQEGGRPLPEVQGLVPQGGAPELQAHGHRLHACVPPEGPTGEGDMFL